jgi:hypothetical protein
MENFKKYFVPGSLGGLLGILAGFLVYYLTGRHYLSFVVLGFVLGAFIGSLIVKTIVIKIDLISSVKNYLAARKAVPPEKLLARRVCFFERLLKWFFAILSVLNFLFIINYVSMHTAILSPYFLMLAGSWCGIFPISAFIFFNEWGGQPDVSTTEKFERWEAQLKRRREYFKKVGPAKYIWRLFLGYFQNSFIFFITIILGALLYVAILTPVAITLFIIFVVIWALFLAFRFYILLVDKYSLASTIVIALPVTLALYFRYRGLFDDTGIALGVSGIAFILAGIANYGIGYGFLCLFNELKKSWEISFTKTKIFAYLNIEGNAFLWGMVLRPSNILLSVFNPLVNKVLNSRYQ